MLPRAQPGRPRAEGVKPPLAESGHARRVYLKHGDFIKHDLSENGSSSRAMKHGHKAQGHCLACWVRMEDALARSESGKRWLDVAVDRPKDVIGERATNRAMLSCSKLGVGEAVTGPVRPCACTFGPPIGLGRWVRLRCPCW